MGDVHLDPSVDYPLSIHRRDLLFTPTGKSIDDITIEAVVAGTVESADLRISAAPARRQPAARGRDDRDIGQARVGDLQRVASECFD